MNLIQDGSRNITAYLLLSTQRALLGAISTNIMGICVNLILDKAEMVIFVEGKLLPEQYEVLDIATTEIMADFSGLVLVSLKVFEDCVEPLKEWSGIWVFLRYRCSIEFVEK